MNLGDGTRKQKGTVVKQSMTIHVIMERDFSFLSGIDSIKYLLILATIPRQ